MIDLSFLGKYGIIGGIIAGGIIWIYRIFSSNKVLKKEIANIKSKNEIIESEKFRIEESLKNLFKSMESYDEKIAEVLNDDISTDNANKMLNTYDYIEKPSKASKIQQK